MQHQIQDHALGRTSVSTTTPPQWAVNYSTMEGVWATRTSLKLRESVCRDVALRVRSEETSAYVWAVKKKLKMKLLEIQANMNTDLLCLPSCVPSALGAPILHGPAIHLGLWLHHGSVCALQTGLLPGQCQQVLQQSRVWRILRGDERWWDDKVDKKTNLISTQLSSKCFMSFCSFTEGELLSTNWMTSGNITAQMNSSNRDVERTSTT